MPSHRPQSILIETIGDHAWSGRDVVFHVSGAFPSRNQTLFRQSLCRDHPDGVPAALAPAVRDAEHLLSRYRNWQGPEFEAVLEDVIRQVVDHGPAPSGHIGEREEPRRSGSWEWHPSKTALEYLWRSVRLTQGDGRHRAAGRGDAAFLRDTAEGARERRDQCR